MPFEPPANTDLDKDWKDRSESLQTPINAAALEDLEARANTRAVEVAEAAHDQAVQQVAELAETVVTKTRLPIDASEFQTGTSGSTKLIDLAAAVAEMESSGRGLHFSSGAWRPTGFNISLDAAAGYDRYRFTGEKGWTSIGLPAGMEAGDYLFLANVDEAGDPIAETFKAHPWAIFEHLAFFGTASPNGSIFNGYNRSFAVKNVLLSTLKKGFRVAGYTDAVRIEGLYGTTDVSDWMYEQVSHGDGLVVNGFFADACPGMSLTKCHGGVIDGLIGGYHEFIASNLSVDGAHVEGDRLSTGSPLFRVRDTRIKFGAGTAFCTPDRAAIQIDDSGFREGSSVTIDDEFKFRNRLDDPASDQGARQGVAIRLQNFTARSRLRVRRGVCETWGETEEGGARLIYERIAPRVIADDSTLNGVVTADQSAWAGDVELRFRNSTWEIAAPAPLHGQRSMRRISSTPTLTVQASTIREHFGTTLADGTYYYRAWAVLPSGLMSAAATESSATIDSTQIPVLTSYVGVVPAALRIARGTSPGAYTHWADVPLAHESIELCDQGSHIGGQPWTASTPTLPSGNETEDGVQIAGAQGRKLVHKSGAPTAGTWATGDRVQRNAPSLYGASEDICTSGGTPGTWRATGIVGLTGVVGTATWDPPSLDDGASTTTTVTVTGVSALDHLVPSLQSLSAAGAELRAVRTATDTVTVTLTNRTGGTLDVGSGTLRVLGLRVPSS